MVHRMDYVHTVPQMTLTFGSPSGDWGRNDAWREAVDRGHVRGEGEVRDGARLAAVTRGVEACGAAAQVAVDVALVEHAGQAQAAGERQGAKGTQTATARQIIRNLHK